MAYLVAFPIPVVITSFSSINCFMYFRIVLSPRVILEYISEAAIGCSSLIKASYWCGFVIWHYRKYFICCYEYSYLLLYASVFRAVKQSLCSSKLFLSEIDGLKTLVAVFQRNLYLQGKL